MNITDIASISTAILTSLGGGSLIIFGCSSWLGKVWATRLMEKEKASHQSELENLKATFLQEIESYKVKLKKSEFIFEKEFEAASELVALKLSLMPDFSYPHMDWEDVCDHLACISGNIENKVGDYISKHGAVLSKEVLSHLSNSRGRAGEVKFMIEDHDVSYEAEKVWKELSSAETILLAKVHSQATI